MSGLEKKITTNKRAGFDYTFIKTLTAGLVLKGWQVKSIRAGHLSLANNPFVVLSEKGIPFISGMSITPLKESASITDSKQSIPLLLKKSEITKLFSLANQKGYTIVVQDLHWKSGKVKATIALAKGNSDRNKASILKEKQIKRETAVEVKKASRSNF